MANTPKPEGWWSLELRGLRVAVIRDIGVAEIPAPWKTVLQAEITSRDAKFNFFTVHAHYCIHEGKGTLNLTIQPSTVAV